MRTSLVYGPYRSLVLNCSMGRAGRWLLVSCLQWAPASLPLPPTPKPGQPVTAQVSLTHALGRRLTYLLTAQVQGPYPHTHQSPQVQPPPPHPHPPHPYPPGSPPGPGPCGSQRCPAPQSAPLLHTTLRLGRGSCSPGRWQPPRSPGCPACGWGAASGRVGVGGGGGGQAGRGVVAWVGGLVAVGRSPAAQPAASALPPSLRPPPSLGARPANLRPGRCCRTRRDRRPPCAVDLRMELSERRSVSEYQTRTKRHSCPAYRSRLEGAGAGPEGVFLFGGSL